MKILDIALKDMLQSFRSIFALMMMFVEPIMITGLITFAFGGMGGGGSGGLDLPMTRVVVANQDRADAASGISAGEEVVKILQSPELADILDVTITGDEAGARAAIDDRKADVAVIVPEEFSKAMTVSGARATITLYHDPTLTLGPGIVKAVIDGIMDGFSGYKITADVTEKQLAAQGQAMDADTLRSLAVSYMEWAQEQNTTEGAAADPTISLRSPSGSDTTETSALAGILGPVMAGMLIFFVFFGGAYTAQSIVREDENGTLARLSTTPTPAAAILGGKLVSVFLMVLVQSIVLLVSSALIFNIRWGEPAGVIAMTLSMLVAASGFGVLVTSFIRNSRQGGVMIGGVMTVCGLIGGLFTSGFNTSSAALELASRFVPHGWALHGWKLAMAGATIGELLVPTAMLLAMGVIFFVIGTMLFRRRFA
jgi:ABC-2 type transport system permease protein